MMKKYKYSILATSLVACAIASTNDTAQIAVPVSGDSTITKVRTTELSLQPTITRNVHRKKDMTDKAQTIAVLTSPFYENLLSRSYSNLVSRVQPNGFFPESLTGAYNGMFPRSIGALAQLFLATDREEPIEQMLRYCFRSMSQFKMERVPHVIGQENESGEISRVDDVDQIDGQAHVILAWARLALAKGQTLFREETYGFAATLMDRSSTAPYLSFCTGWRIEPGLVLNTHLEHSRECQFWHAYDFLSQSFVAAALESMRDVAIQMNDKEHAERWASRLQALEKNISDSMTRDLDGQKIYVEMLLPTGREPAVFPGISWLNLAPVAAGWRGVDRTLLSNTIGAWHERSAIRWKDICVTASDWLPDQPGNEIYTKVLGWDLVYSAQQGEWNRVLDILSFLEQVNGDDLPSEAFVYDSKTDNWSLRDRGNGEQVAWLCWGLVECRNILGLPPLP